MVDKSFILYIGIVSSKGGEPSNAELYDVVEPIEFKPEAEDKLSTCSKESTDQEYWDSDMETRDFDYDDRVTEIMKMVNPLINLCLL